MNVSGTLAGQLTIASQNDIIIKSNLVYHQYPSGTDVLGLIADNDVAIYHPVNSSGVNQAGSLTDPTVDAAILALDHSFFVQNWTKGAPLGNLTVNGVITQEFRGAVGTFSGTPPVISTGYNKNYTYDTRLEVSEPAVLPQPDAVGVATDLVRGDHTDRDALIGAAADPASAAPGMIGGSPRRCSLA